MMVKKKRKEIQKETYELKLVVRAERWKSEGGAKRHWRAEMRSMRRWQHS
jgi:hypothetical protein